jgi:hypothetical protein
MIGRIGSCVAGVCFVLASTASCYSQALGTSPTAKNSTGPETARPLSPLHAFLGIDPVTGEFKPANAAASKVAPPAPAAVKNALQPKSTSTADPDIGENVAGNSTLRDILSRAAESGELPAANTRIGDTTIDELGAEITKAINTKDDHALEAALGKVTRNLGYGAAAFPGAQYVQLATLAFLLYPLGIVVMALGSAWGAKRRPLRTDRDRRHDGRQLRRRLALAASTAATIGLVWWAGECNFWLSEPAKLLAALGVLTLLLLVSAGLRLLIRRAASDYARRTIEDLRFQHAALCEEVKQLRRRLQDDGIPETV